MYEYESLGKNRGLGWYYLAIIQHLPGALNLK